MTVFFFSFSVSVSVGVLVSARTGMEWKCDLRSIYSLNYDEVSAVEYNNIFFFIVYILGSQREGKDITLYKKPKKRFSDRQVWVKSVFSMVKLKKGSNSMSASMSLLYY